MHVFNDEYWELIFVKFYWKDINYKAYCHYNYRVKELHIFNILNNKDLKPIINIEEIQKNLEKIQYFLSSNKISRSNHQKKWKKSEERSNISTTQLSKERREKSGLPFEKIGRRKKRTGKEKIIKHGAKEILVENATKPRKLRNCHEPLLTRRRAFDPR